MSILALFNKKQTKEPGPMPRHIAIIMDGNGRWAKKRKLPRTAGHAAGASTFKAIARYGNKIGLEYMTVYAFSTENWKRPEDEVNNIMNILRDYLKEAKNFKDENIKVKFIGNTSVLDDDIKELINDAERESENATGMHLNIALNYGGRAELVHSVKAIAEKVKCGEIAVEDINEDLISQNIYTAGQPDPDIIVRPSGEYRLSNFLTWQSAYSEFWFSDILWPDFTTDDVDAVLKDFQKRHRRFGGV
jgi:undecaprenyl diphosphate synthase